jgi:transglutaminase-like putative cysteine protease
MCRGIAVFSYLFISIWPSSAAHAVPTQDPPCTAARSHEVTYDVSFSVVVTPPYHTKVLRVWLPVPPSDDTQTVSDYRVTPYPIAAEVSLHTEPVFANTFAYLEYHNLQGAQIIRADYRVTVAELRWNLPDEVAPDPAEWPAAFDRHRHGDSTIVVDDGIRALAQRIVPEPRGAAPDMRRIAEWIMGNIRYDHREASLTANSLWGMQHGCGHCSDYHGLAAALGRALGHATRVSYGINPLPKNSPSHCKVEVFVPEVGWVSYDLSETQKLIGRIHGDGSLPEQRKAELVAAAKERLFQGFRDNTWYRQTVGTDYDLAPAGSRRAAVVRTAYIEADGEPLPDPDPANDTKREFAWMTVHEYRASVPVTSPFAGYEGLAVGGH